MSDQTLEVIISNQAPEQPLTTLQDPFQRQNFDKMVIVIHNDREMSFYDYARCEGTIYFKNGPTEGSHKIKGGSLFEIHTKIIAFAQELQERNK